MPKGKIPEIRFRGFSGEWEKEKLGTRITHIVDNRGKNPIYYCTDGIPIIDNFMIKNTRYPNLSTATRFIDDDLFKFFIRTHAEFNDILITLVGNGIGNITLFPKDKSVIIQNTLGLRFSNNKIFMFYIFLFKNKEIIHLDRGMAQPSIRQDELLDIDLAIPTDIIEQTKIGNYFQNLDKLIEQKEKKHQKLKQFKKAMLDKMFPKEGASVPEIRFEGFSGDWEEKQLREIVDLCSGRDYKHLSAGNIPVYGTGGYMLSVNEALSYGKDAVGIGRKGTIDKPYILKAPFWTVDTLFYGIPQRQNYLPFVYSLFQKINWKQKDESTGVPSLSKVAINGIEVFSSHFNEQTKIGNYFQKLDKLLSLQQKELEKLKNIKKASLDKMFV